MKNTLQRDNDEARRMALERLEKPDFDQQQRLAGEDRPPLEETVEHKGSCLFAILGLILMLVITISPTTVRSSAENASGKLSEKRICELGGNSSSPSQTIRRIS